MRFSYWRPLVLAMLAVVASFVLTLWYSHFRMLRIEGYADAIAFNAEPSMAHLGEVRAQLQRIAVATDLYFEGRTANDPAASRHAREDAQRARRSIDLSIARYRQLPAYPGELELADQLPPALVLLDAKLAASFAEIRPSDGMLGNEHQVYQAISGVDDVIERLSELNTDETIRNGEAILQARRSGAAMAMALGGISVGLALFATALAFLALRGQARLSEEHNEFLEVRAGELELFARRVAHDLQNPLAAMSLRLAVGEGRSTDPVARESLDKLHQIVRSMTTIVDGLLQFAIGGARPDRAVSSDLGAVVDQVILESRAAAEREGIRLELEGGDPAVVGCSRGALTSVLSNLVRNAVKYVDGDDPVVAVRWVRRAVDVRVEVEDNGPGIPAGSETRLFVPFVRLHQGIQPGLGLGLATVKRIVEAHGGRVGVERAEPGSRFWFELPLAEPRPGAV